MNIKVGFKTHGYYLSTMSSPGFGSCHADKHIAEVPHLSPKQTLYLVGGSYTGACEETSLWSSAFLSIITALTISTKPMWATKTSTYLCIARFAELLDFASRNISVFITLPALVHSEPSADTALPGSCIGNTGISLQGGGLCFLRKGIWKWRRTIT